MRPRLKKGIVPHIFDCQKGAFTNDEGEDTVKRKRLRRVEDGEHETKCEETRESVQLDTTNCKRKIANEKVNIQQTESLPKTTTQSKCSEES